MMNYQKLKLYFIFRHNGVRGYYKGLLPNIMRVVPATALTFVVYEHTSHFLLGLRLPEEPQQEEKSQDTCFLLRKIFPLFWLYFDSTFFFFFFQFVHKILPENPQVNSKECSIDFEVTHTLEIDLYDVNVVKRNMDSKRIKGIQNIQLLHTQMSPFAGHVVIKALVFHIVSMST